MDVNKRCYLVELLNILQVGPVNVVFTPFHIRCESCVSLHQEVLLHV